MARIPWTPKENDLVVADYFDMLIKEINRVEYSKTQHRHRLQKQINRSNGSIEYKRQNISAILEKLGIQWIKGYKPASNYQSSLIDAVLRWLKHNHALDLHKLTLDGVERPPLFTNQLPSQEQSNAMIMDQFSDKHGKDGRERTLMQKHATLRKVGKKRSKTLLAKKYISEPRYRLHLYDMVNEETALLLSHLLRHTPENAIEETTFDSKSLEECEHQVQRLGAIISLISFWGKRTQHGRILRLPFSGLLDVLTNDNTKPVLTNCWYSICLLFYLSGIGAIANENYEMLKALFYSLMQHGCDREKSEKKRKPKNLLEVAVGGMRHLCEMSMFQGDNTTFATRSISKSSHLFKFLPAIFPSSGIFLTNNDFDLFFNRFEMLQAIAYCRLTTPDNHCYIVGRYSTVRHCNRIFVPLAELTEEVALHKENWAPIKSGLFSCSSEDLTSFIEKLSNKNPRNEPT